MNADRMVTEADRERIRKVEFALSLLVLALAACHQPLLPRKVYDALYHPALSTSTACRRTISFAFSVQALAQRL